MLKRSPLRGLVGQACRVGKEREIKRRLTDMVVKGMATAVTTIPPAYPLMPYGRDHFLRSRLLVSDTKLPLESRLNERFFAAD